MRAILKSAAGNDPEVDILLHTLTLAAGGCNSVDGEAPGRRHPEASMQHAAADRCQVAIEQVVGVVDTLPDHGAILHAYSVRISRICHSKKKTFT